MATNPVYLDYNATTPVAPEVADGDRSLILDQVANGVAVRRAILEDCI